MDITKMSARDAIATAYAGVPSVIWEFAGSDKQAKFAKVRKYCPCCKKANTLRDIEPTNDNDQNRYKCRSCGHLCRFPAALVPSGPNQSSSQVSRVNPGSRIAKAMEASEVMAAVESLPVELRLWALWVYTDPEQTVRDQIEGKLLAHIVDELDGMERNHLTGLKASADVIRIINMTMNCFRHRMRCKKSLYKHSDYAQAIGRDRAQFTGTRLWARISREIVNKLVDIDSKSLQPVARVLRELSGEDVA